MASQEVFIRDGTPDDIPGIQQLVSGQESNPLIYLPSDNVRQHILDIRTGSTSAVVAQARDELVGVTTYQTGLFYQEYQPAERRTAEHGELAIVVVRDDYNGRGVGTALAQLAIARLLEIGVQEIYSSHHADNASSQRMLAKSGMKALHTFDDPDIRPSGSRRSVVVCFQRHEDNNRT